MNLSHPSLLNIMEGENYIYYIFPHKSLCYFVIILNNFTLFSKYFQIIAEFDHRLRTIIHFDMHLGQFWILHSMDCQKEEKIPILLAQFQDLLKRYIHQSEFLILPGKQVKQNFLFYFEGYDPSSMQLLSNPSKSRYIIYNSNKNDSFQIVFIKCIFSESFLEMVSQLHQYIQTIDVKLFFMVYSHRNQIVGMDGLLISKSEKNSNAFFNYLQTRDLMKNFRYIKPNISLFRKFARRIPLTRHKIMFSQLETFWNNIKSTDLSFVSNLRKNEKSPNIPFFSVIQSKFGDALILSEFVIIPSISTTIYILDQINVVKIQEYLSELYQKYSYHLLIFSKSADRDSIIKSTPIEKLKKIKILIANNSDEILFLIKEHVKK